MKQTKLFNRLVYLALALAGIYFALVAKDYSNASICLGIALAFDPFDYTVKWGDRPRWQKNWLILHLAFVAGLFGASIGGK